MKRRMFYTVRQGYAAMKHVLLVEPEGENDVTLYCPPGVAEGPWVESFPTREQALDLASVLARKIGQVQVKRSATRIDWRLHGLELIGDADERDRRESNS